MKLGETQGKHESLRASGRDRLRLFGTNSFSPGEDTTQEALPVRPLLPFRFQPLQTSPSNARAADGEPEREREEQRAQEKVEENRSVSKMRLHARFRQVGRDVAEIGVAMASTLPRMTQEHRSVRMQVDSQCEGSSLC